MQEANCKTRTKALWANLDVSYILSCHPFYKVKSWIASQAKTVLQNGASHILIKPTHSRGQQLCEFLIDTVIVILIITIIIIVIIIIIISSSSSIIIIIIIILLYFIFYFNKKEKLL